MSKYKKSLNFDPPKPGAKLFTLYFRNNLGWPFKQPTMVFPITINTNNTEQPTEIADNPLVIPINQPLETNSPGFVATLISVEKLSDTHMRWNFEFWNKSGVGLDVTAGGGSYIADDLGNRYALITPLTGGLDPGVRSEESIVFEGPREGAKVFTLYLTNNLGWPFRQPTIITSINFDQKL